MGWLCPVCAADSFETDLSLELPADYYDEYSVALVRCNACGFRGVTTYRESRRGRLDSEAVDYACHQLSDADMERLTTLACQCPAPRSSRCQCPVHRLLSGTESKGLDSIARVLKSFELKYVA